MQATIYCIVTRVCRKTASQIGVVKLRRDQDGRIVRQCPSINL